MANPVHLEKLNEGVDAWNQWRAENQQIEVDLSEADLGGKDLTSADLRGANLEGANLRGVRLGPAFLSDTYLRQADLSQANLQHVNFAESYLSNASLREANLQGADLSGVTGGLRTEQLAGADLTGAKLPDDLKTLYDKLENAKGISENARKVFLVVLAACLYCWLATAPDVNLITNRPTSPLPTIQASVPVVGFYVIVPLLLLCAYFYFNFYLQKLW